MDKKGKVRAEILNDLRNWHKEYVPDHDLGLTRRRRNIRLAFTAIFISIMGLNWNGALRR